MRSVYEYNVVQRPLHATADTWHLSCILNARFVTRHCLAGTLYLLMFRPSLQRSNLSVLPQRTAERCSTSRMTSRQECEASVAQTRWNMQAAIETAIYQRRSLLQAMAGLLWRVDILQVRSSTAQSGWRSTLWRCSVSSAMAKRLHHWVGPRCEAGESLQGYL